MKKIAIVTDSNSGITQEMGKSMGIYVIPMPFFIDGELFLMAFIVIIVKAVFDE